MGFTIYGKHQMVILVIYSKFISRRVGSFLIDLKKIKSQCSESADRNWQLHSLKFFNACEIMECKNNMEIKTSEFGVMARAKEKERGNEIKYKNKLTTCLRSACDCCEALTNFCCFPHCLRITLVSEVNFFQRLYL